MNGNCWNMYFSSSATIWDLPRLAPQQQVAPLYARKRATRARKKCVKQIFTWGRRVSCQKPNSCSLRSASCQFCLRCIAISGGSLRSLGRPFARVCWKVQAFYTSGWTPCTASDAGNLVKKNFVITAARGQVDNRRVSQTYLPPSDWPFPELATTVSVAWLPPCRTCPGSQLSSPWYNARNVAGHAPAISASCPAACGSLESTSTRARCRLNWKNQWLYIWYGFLVQSNIELSISGR